MMSEISKAIPGFESVRVKDGKELVFSNGEVCTLPTDGTNVLIPINGNCILTTYKWLEQFAFHRMYLSPELMGNLGNLYFVPNRIQQTKRPIATVPVFKEPILVEGQYRIIGRYSRYAISVDGRLYDLRERMEVLEYSENNGYIYKNVLDFSLNEYTNVPLHRLIGLAWIFNDDFVDKYTINHKDGDKLNNTLSNLEWVSYSENNQHAINSGFKESVISGRIRNAYTGEVQKFASFRQACALMGSEKIIQYRITSDPSVLLMGKFEVRLDGDSRPWFYETNPIGTKVGRYQITANMPDGSSKVFYRKEDLLEHFKIKNSAGKHIARSIEIIESAIPGLKIELLDLHAVGKHNREQRSFDNPVNTKARSIVVTNTKTGEKSVCRSKHEVARVFNLDRKGIHERMGSSIPWHGLIFEYAEEE